MFIIKKDGLYCVKKGRNILFCSEYEVECKMFIEEINDDDYDF